MEEGNREKRAEGEHKDNGHDIGKGANEEDREWETSMWVLWKRDGGDFCVACRMLELVPLEMFRCKRYGRCAIVNFRCLNCVGGGLREVDVRQVRMGEASVVVVDSFCYIGDVIRCEGGAEATVRGRIACAWKSWRELASL